MACIALKSSDDIKCEIEVQAAKQSVMLKNMLESLGDCDEGEVIPLNEVDGVTLKKVVEWCNHHKGDDLPSDEEEVSEKKIDDITSWDEEFIEVSQEFLYKILLAADFMNVKGLKELCLKTLAKMIIGRPIEEIRKTLNIENDYTPEEEEKIKKNTKWCEACND